MSHNLYILAVWLHILSLVLWLGGALFLVFAAVPYFKTKAPERFLEFLEFSQYRLRNIGWGAFGVFLVTGLYCIHYRFGSQIWFDSSFWTEEPGIFLSIKLSLVLVIWILSFWHDFFIGPQTLTIWRQEKSSVRLAKHRKLTARMGRLIAMLAALVVYFAIRFVRG